MRHVKSFHEKLGIDIKYNIFVCFFTHILIGVYLLWSDSVWRGLHHLWPAAGGRGPWAPNSPGNNISHHHCHDFNIPHPFLDPPVPGGKVRGQRLFRHRLRLHGRDVPHSDQEPGGGDLFPGG